MHPKSIVTIELYSTGLPETRAVVRGFSAQDPGVIYICTGLLRAAFSLNVYADAQ